MIKSIYDLKPKFQQGLQPGVAWVHRRGITPNQVTLLALLGSVVVGMLCLQSKDNPAWLLIIPAWLFVRMALNAIDGMLARQYNLKSVQGAILNEIGDVVSDSVIYLPLVVVRNDAKWAIVLFVIGAILSEFCGVLGQALGANRHYEGPMGKSDRAFWVGCIVLLTFIFPVLLDYWVGMFYLAFVLTLLTCINRMVHVLKELKGG